jgi:hypothetical protein
LASFPFKPYFPMAAPAIVVHPPDIGAGLVGDDKMDAKGANLPPPVLLARSMDPVMLSQASLIASLRNDHGLMGSRQRLYTWSALMRCMAEQKVDHSVIAEVAAAQETFARASAYSAARELVANEETLYKSVLKSWPAGRAILEITHTGLTSFTTAAPPSYPGSGFNPYRQSARNSGYNFGYNYNRDRDRWNHDTNKDRRSRSRSRSRSSGRKGDDRDKRGRNIALKKAKSNCSRCGGRGHWAQECPSGDKN